jgi:drug/metabolite transporter (DMT)-like permease
MTSVLSRQAPIPTGRDYALLLLLGAIWGSSFLLIKVAVATVPPVTVAAGRVIVGAIFIAAVVALQRKRLPTNPGVWAKLSLMGTVGTVAPFALINWGETHIDSGLAAILISAVPIMTIMMAHFLRSDEKINAGKIASLMFGGSGVVLLIGPDALAGIGQDLLGQLAILGAAWCYAVNGLTARQLTGLSPEVVTLGMLLTAAIVAIPLSLWLDRPWQMQASTLSLLAIVTLGILPTSIGYLIAVRIIASAGAGFASLNNYLVPIFGVGWGIALLGEKLQLRAVLALMLIFVGVTAPRAFPALRGLVERRLTSEDVSKLE